jgi:hypothetical protein
MLLEDHFDNDDSYSISSNDSYCSLYINEIYDLHDEILERTLHNPQFFHGVNKINFHDFIYDIIHSSKYNTNTNNFYIIYMKKHHVKYNQYSLEYEYELYHTYEIVKHFSKHFTCIISPLMWSSFCFYHNIYTKY